MTIWKRKKPKNEIIKRVTRLIIHKQNFLMHIIIMINIALNNIFIPYIYTYIV